MRPRNGPRSKILEITSYPPPRAGWGVRVQHVKRCLEALGHECVVLNIGKSRRLKSPEFVGVRNGLDYVVKVLRYAARGYTVHAHVNGDSEKGFALTLIALAIARLLGASAVLTFHAGPYQKYFPQERARWLTPMYKVLFGLPGTIVCNSAPVKAKIEGYGVRPDKIVPIPAFSRQYLEHERCALDERIEAFVSSVRPCLSTYVFYRPEFFISSLMEAMALLVRRTPGIGLVVMGCSDGSEATADQIRRLGLERNVLLCGDLPHDAFLTLMGRSSIFVRTPAKDGVCSSVLEALSLGVPVVASENGTRPASVVTFRANDAEDLAAAVGRVLAEYDTYRRAVVAPAIEDTVAREVQLLAGAVSGAPAWVTS